MVNKDGSATITFKDNTKRTIPASLLVAKDESDSDKYKPVMPERIPVVNPDSLSDKDKQAVIDAFKEKNKDNKDFNDHLAKEKAIEFDADGKNLVVTYEDGSKATIPVSELVFQGPKISDWAPYVVPDPIEVENLSSLTEQEKTQIINEFDKANTGITPYDEAKEKNSNKAPVTVDQTTGDATITWADGSKTTIAAWQFLKQKPKTTPSPEPQPPAPTSEEKTFIVESLDKPIVVTFDPFKTTSEEINAGNAKTQLDDLKNKTLKNLKGKDSKDNTKEVTITDVEYSVENGVGYITFKAQDYKPAKYPMGAFFKQNTNNKVLPQNDTTVNNGSNSQDYHWKYRKFKIQGEKPTTAEKNAAVKQFVSDNYNGTVNDCSNGTYILNSGLTPKEGTKGLAINNTSGLSKVVADDTSIKVLDKSGTAVITIDDPYEKSQGQQGGADTTVADLKDQAKALLKQRQDDGLTNDDLKRAGITDADQLNNAKIDGLPKDKATETYLRDLIRKLTDARKAEYKYNTNPYEVSDPTAKQTDNDFQAAVKQFLKANYEDSSASEKIDGLTFTSNSATLTNKGWTPKAGTSCLDLNSDTVTYGITTVVVGNDGKSVDFKNGDTVLFNVPADKLYKKKTADPTPAPTPDALAQMKEDAKKIIDKNPYLTPKQKEDFKKQIGDATTADKIKEILKNAADKGKENANSNDPNTQQTINNNKGGGDEKKNQELKAAKEAAKKAIENLPDLTEQEKNTLKTKVDNATSIDGTDGVNSVLDSAKKLSELNTAKKEAKEEANKLYFLDHGKGGKDDSSDPNHAEDAALNELLGTKPAEDSTLADLAKKLKKDSKATAQEIKNALEAAKRQNAINEENAKNAGIAKLDALLQQLTDAENGLTADQKTAVSEAVTKAKTAINDAKTTVNKATKPSDIKTAVDGVSIKDAMDDINTQVTNAQQNNKQQQENDNKDALANEKKEQIERIKNSDLPDADKQKAIDDINNAKKIGDPTAIADRALKAQKIKDALAAIDNLEHLNDAQKKAYKDIINTTDAGNHKDEQGKDTGVDDIDDALANAINTDNAMARLEDLKIIADKFAESDKYKGLQDGDDKKKAFDDAATAAGAVLDRDKGDAKGAAEVNDIYADLLKAMQAIDNSVKGAGVKTDALAAEIGSDKGLKPSETDPKTPGDSVYTTASKDKKDAFDQALNEAEQALNTANDDNANYKKEGTTPRTPKQEADAQKKVDEALDKLIKARLALDGVNTKPLEQQIAKDADIKKSVEYTKASDDKKQAYDKALAAAQKLITDLTAPSADGSAAKFGNLTLDSKDAKQKALDAALKALSDAAEALDGKDTTPVPPSGDDNTGSGSESDSGSGTSTSTSGGVNKQNLINQINTTENPGGANPGSGAAGTNPSTPGAGAQGAGMGAVAPGSGSGAAGTGAAGAASAGVDNKAVNNAVENAPEVKQADAAVKQAAATLDEALAQAKRVAADPHATQAQVDAAAAKLADARKALADAQANAAKVRAAVRSRVIKGMRSRGNAGIATGANVATTGLMATMIAAIGGAFATRRMRTKHANRD